MKFQSWRFDPTRVCGILRRLGLIPGLRETTVKQAVILGVVILASTGSALGSDAGQVAGWGHNSYGQFDPLGVSGPCKMVATYETHSVAVRADGTVRAWGAISSVPSDLGSCVKVAAGKTHCLALQTDGVVRGWGDCDYGACTPPSDLVSAIDISAGQRFSIAIRSDGKIQGWGNNDSGSLLAPSQGVFRHVASGRLHSLAIDTSGVVSAWGWNGWYQCNVPANLGPCTEVAGGWYHSLALRTDGTVVAWGYNYGDAGATSVPGDLGPCIGISASEISSVAIRADGGTVRGWGSNGWNQLSVPASVGAVTQIALGRYHALAVKAAPAVITGVLPISGPMSGGTPITISGSGFREGVSVLIGGSPASSVRVASSTSITAVTPPGLPGMTNVTVSMIGNVATAEAFYYRPDCGSDLDQDGEVTAADISIVLLDFGPCYEPPAALAVPPAPTPLLVPDESTPASTPPAPQSARPTPQPRGTAS